MSALPCCGQRAAAITGQGREGEVGQKEGCKEVEEVGRCWEVALPVSQGSKSLLILINLIGFPLQTDSKINFLRISRWQVQSSKLQARGPYEHWTLCDCFGLRLVSISDLIFWPINS